MEEIFNPEALAVANGSQPIGAAQRTIAFSAVAAGPTGFIQFTTATHNLKKGSCFYNPAGAYAGVHRVVKVISSTVVRVVGTFGATDSGTLSLTGALDGFGFFVDSVPLTIAELTTDDPNFDFTSFVATAFIAGTWVPREFKKIRTTAGNITVVRKPIPTTLSYSNR